MSSSHVTVASQVYIACDALRAHTHTHTEPRPLSSVNVMTDSETDITECGLKLHSALLDFAYMSFIKVV